MSAECTESAESVIRKGDVEHERSVIKHQIPDDFFMVGKEKKQTKKKTTPAEVIY